MDALLFLAISFVMVLTAGPISTPWHLGPFAIGPWIAGPWNFGPWHIIGFIGLGTFSARFIVQWIVSERRKESVIPVSFWYLSIIGSLLLLSYALRRKDPVFILSYLFNSIIYLRNLYFIRAKKKQLQ
jgi:lipid-A-disaccharide synthase-like uncharacterized protein